MSHLSLTKINKQDMCKYQLGCKGLLCSIQGGAQTIMSQHCQDCGFMECHYCSREERFIVKVLLLGDSGVGKRHMLGRFCDNVFHRYSNPLTSTAIRTIEVEGQRVKLFIETTGGRERYFRRISFPRSFYRHAAAAMLVYDVTKRSTFENIDYWRKAIFENATYMYHSKVPILLIGNKCDLQHQREVAREEATVYAGKHEMSYIETSALNSVNIDSAFESIIKEVHCSKDADDCSLFGTSREIIVNSGKDMMRTRCCGII